ncbi:MAG: hypothetical protein FWD98_00330 [Defluviitaleaceae bacterium]|nr:hypothetical protein [Defluviitaleaceae bacterium]
MAKKNKQISTAGRNVIVGVAVFFVIVLGFVMVTPQIDNIAIPVTPDREVMTPQRPGIVDIPAVSATVRDNNGEIRNISVSAALDFDERQVSNYDTDDLRAIIMNAVMQLDGDLFENMYSMEMLSDHIRGQLDMHVDPSHLLGVHITEIESGHNPIMMDTQDNTPPRTPTWQMN